MKHLLFTVIIALWVCLYAAESITEAAVWHVAPAGNDETGDGSETTPFLTIQRGIDAAFSADTVLVHDGYYPERISFLGKGIVVGSEYMYEPDTNHILNTVIDGDTSSLPMSDDTGSVVRFVNGEDSASVLYGLTVQNGAGINGNGGGIYVDGSSPKTFNCLIKSNVVEGKGGGAYSTPYDAQPYFFQCEVTGNSADKGGGMAFGSPGVSINECRISNNAGGGISFFYTSPIRLNINISGCIIENNTGTGIECPDAYSIDITGCEVSNNTGTGIAFRYASELTGNIGRRSHHISSSVIAENSLGVLCRGYISLYVDSCLIENNNQGIITGGDAGLILTNSSIIGNGDFLLSKGGGILCFSQTFSPMTISNCLFENNIAQAGGAINMETWNKSSDGRYGHLIENCTFAGNAAYIASSIYGGGYLRFSLNKSILAFGVQGEAIFCSDTTQIENISCTDIYGNEGGDWVGAISDYGNINGNFSLDPEFCEPDSGDYHLYNTSPCAPANNSCDTVIGMYGVGCSVAEVTTLEIEDEASMLNVVNHKPKFVWDYEIPRDFTPTNFEIKVDSNTDWDPVDMWDPDPFESIDTFVVYDGEPLVDGETYYVRLRIGDDGVWTNWYDTSFRMNSVPSVPVLISPVNDAFTILQPVLSLQTSTDAENDVLYYIFQVLNDAQDTITTSPPILGLDNWTAVWQCDMELTENEHYWWKARATDNYEESEWSPPESFYVNDTNTAPSAFSLILPPDTDALFSNLLRPTFSWQASTDDDPLDTILYTLRLAADSDFNSVNDVDSIYATEYSLTFDLDLGRQYWWKVRAKDKSGDSAWSSEIFSFWTKRCGDTDNDDSIDVSDAVYTINYIFIGGGPPIPYEAGDVNCDGFANVSDAVWLINYVFMDGKMPCDVNGDLIPDC